MTRISTLTRTCLTVDFKRGSSYRKIIQYPRKTDSLWVWPSHFGSKNICSQKCEIWSVKRPKMNLVGFKLHFKIEQSWHIWRPLYIEGSIFSILKFKEGVRHVILFLFGNILQEKWYNKLCDILPEVYAWVFPFINTTWSAWLTLVCSG